MADSYFGFETLQEFMPPRHEEVLINGEPYYQHVLNIAKEEIHEMSVEQGELTYLGTLNELLGAENFEGKISLKNRLDSGEVTESELEQATAFLAESYVATSPGATKRCVDGRSKLGYSDKDPESYGEAQGPQVQGGTFDEAVAMRLEKGASETDTLEADIKTVVEMDKDFAPGVHTDKDHEHDGLGCGAIKGQEAKLEYYGDEKKFKAIRGGVSALNQKLSMGLDETPMADLPAHAAQLLALGNSYYGDKEQQVNNLTKVNPNAKQVVDGVHKEAFVIINMVENTTLHTSHFNALTDDEIEAFGLDGWNIKQSTMLADAIATLMNLTDGSIKVFARLRRAA